ncbi:MAG: hypothetical protein Q7K54_01645 [Candidatus Parcubacteria bacterium]|nr:hypothetical protein [Candidatus Parcubacteria bacterium]
MNAKTTNKELAEMYWKVTTQSQSSYEKSRYRYHKGKIARCPVVIAQKFEEAGNLDEIGLSDHIKFVLMLIFQKGLEEARTLYPEIVAERDKQFQRSDNKVFFSYKIVAVGRMTDRTRTPRKLPTREP